jgi:hypothetical protein
VDSVRKLLGPLHGSTTGWFSHSILALTSIDSINYAASIGIFVTHISKGHKLREKVFLSLCSCWALVVWGGIGLRQSRQALELEKIGLTFFNDSQHFLVDENNTCYDVPQDDLPIWL